MLARLIPAGLLAAVAWANVINDVREAAAHNNFALGDSIIQKYRGSQGVTPELIDALSWMGRGALEAKQYAKANSYAKETYRLAVEELKKRPLDADGELPIALGAAIEVEAQVLAARGDRSGAVAYLRAELAKYGTTSIRTRIQKNINLLNLVGKLAPALDEHEFLGSSPQPLALLKGKPVVLFFWAHWCGDCKAEAPIITQLRTEFAPKGLAVVGPTKLYGYTAQIEHASPSDELAYIDAVRHRFYGGLLDMPVPISKYNFDAYGASTTPTLVLLDRTGKVAMYHPGALPYDQLRAAIEKVVTR